MTSPSSVRSRWSGRRREAAAARAAVRAGAESIELKGTSGAAVLLLHGFGDTPQTFCYLAPALRDSGFTVRAPLLPGHGTDVRDFACTGASDWLGAAREALDDLRSTHDRVALGGLSMGGALAVLLAAESRWLRALVLIAPYLQMPPRTGLLSAIHRVWAPFVDVVQSGSDLSIRDPAERARSLGYGACTPGTLHELWRLGRAARRRLTEVRTPTLLIQSRHDNRIKPRLAERAYSSLGATKKKIVWVENAGHIVTVDYGHERVTGEVRDWLAAHLSPSVTGAK